MCFLVIYMGKQCTKHPTARVTMHFIILNVLKDLKTNHFIFINPMLFKFI